MEADESDGSDAVCSCKSPQLPEECLYEILTRVPISAQHICARVCRSWRRLAFGPSFDALNSIRTKMLSGFILLHFFSQKHEFKFLSMHDNESSKPVHFSISSLLPCSPQHIGFVAAAAPAHGILLLNLNLSPFKGDTQRYYITRLGTACHRHIPNPPTPLIKHFSSIVYGANASFDEFKIVQICEPEFCDGYQEDTCICNIFDSVTDTWKRSIAVPYKLLVGKQTVVVKNTAYWMMEPSYWKNYEVNYHRCTIIAFDVEEERGEVIQAPIVLRDGSKKSSMWKMAACGDKLFLVRVSGEDVKVWMMAEAGGEFQKWEWIGLVSMQRLKDRNFAFEEGVDDLQLMLLETLYRELWYEIKGRELVYTMNYIYMDCITRMYLDISNL